MNNTIGPNMDNSKFMCYSWNRLTLTKICFVWVRNLIRDLMGNTLIEDVW